MEVSLPRISSMHIRFIFFLVQGESQIKDGGGAPAHGRNQIGVENIFGSI
uniref:Uncharacterized protein n=1 Tax=Setaria viridis TaxID=4556 RepID=A0A4U6TJ66_SETVI|nr:hypothetical protein SEVIR_8G162801v2 [Setaria viridis]